MKSTIYSNQKSQLTVPDYVIREFMSSGRGFRCRVLLGDERALQLLQSVYAWCTVNMRTLSCNHKYLARDLCGADNWKPMVRQMCVCAGICLAFLEACGALPLRVHKTRSGKGPKFYWIRLAGDAVNVTPRSLPKPVVLSAKDIVVNRP